MVETLIWLLVVANGSSRTQPQVMERFLSVEQCEHVRKNLPYMSSDGTGAGYSARCIQARIAVPKG